MERLSPSFHCPWLSVVAVWWSLVRFRRAISFLFLMQNCCFGVHSAVRLGILVEAKKRPWGTHS